MELGPAPEFFVSDLCAAEIIDGCVIRFTMAAECAGVITPQCSLLWTVPKWIEARAPIHTVLLELNGMAQPATVVRRALRLLVH